MKNNIQLTLLFETNMDPKTAVSYILGHYAMFTEEFCEDGLVKMTSGSCDEIKITKKAKN